MLKEGPAPDDMASPVAMYSFSWETIKADRHDKGLAGVRVMNRLK